MIALKPTAKLNCSKGDLYVRPIILDSPKPIYLVVDAKEPANQELVGEILSLIGRFDRDRAKEHFTTLDSFMRQALHIAQKHAIREKLIEADLGLITNIASSILVNWREMPAGQVINIKLLLSELALSLATARNPALVQAGQRVNVSKNIKDSLGRFNPLIVETRLKAAIRDYGIEQAQGELVALSTQARRLNAIELGSQVKASIDKLFETLNLSDVHPPTINSMLNRLAIKPYYFAVQYAKKLITDFGINHTTTEHIKQAFAYEAALISISDLLSIMRDDPSTHRRGSLSLKSFVMVPPVEDDRYIDHHAEVVRELLNLESALRLLKTVGGGEQNSVKSHIGKQIASIKDTIRYRNW